MARKHLHSVSIRCTSSELKAYDVPYGHQKAVEYRKRFLAPHDMVERARCLLAYIGNALRDAKVVTTSPKITELHINLTNTPSEQPEYYRRGERWDLIVDVDCSALAIVELPMDHKILGEFFIDVVKQGLEKMSDYSELPFSIISEACERFRATDYKFPYKIGEGTIDGTKVKGRLDAVASCVSTERFFSAAYRGKELFRTQVLGSDIPNLGLGGSYNGFEWADDVITIKRSYWLELMDLPPSRKEKNHTDPSEINLSDFPEARDFIRTKLV